MVKTNGKCPLCRAQVPLAKLRKAVYPADTEEDAANQGVRMEAGKLDGRESTDQEPQGTVVPASQVEMDSKVKARTDLQFSTLCVYGSRVTSLHVRCMHAGSGAAAEGHACR